MRFFLFLAFAAVIAAHSIFLRQNTTLPSTFKWTSTDILVSPKNDSRGIAGIKDPSIVYYRNTYHVFASTAKAEGYNLVYFNFTNFSEAGAAPFYYLDQSGIGTGYRAAPEVFYFEPQKLWYLIYQNGNAAYSTNKDISDPAGWTAPKNFYRGTPALIEEGLKTPQQGYWVDMWVICDDAECHLFSSDDNGRLYRSQTTLSSFPEGMSDPVIAMQANKNDLFEASLVYSISPNLYLLLVECIGAAPSSAGGVRYFRSWTSSSISGPWAALAATETNPFLGENNVLFTGTQWTNSLSHGEIIRTQLDQTLRITPCNMRFLYQGVEPTANVTYNALPWRLGLASQIDGKC
ncbi:glycoside hydrolase family 62 protein [Lentithecium fluviatile CBS 122367]|uniref:Alpha-L-arabinofuranosidase n=1 Tax=Lentithecium fluviatile CBS 122367 TaxID=1168545 RepID=A0A6G1IQQ1_9PLEO|nr:glycoside hydrolase family 62 protein [Lentithecium fluviatile CBS 122367]